MNDYWYAGELEKLLGSLAAHPSTLPGGSNDRDIHKRGGSILDFRLSNANLESVTTLSQASQVDAIYSIRGSVSVILTGTGRCAESRAGGAPSH